MVKTILGNPNVRVVVQSRESFIHALDRFSKRLDKGYSLTDCSSMNVMEAEGIKDVLPTTIILHKKVLTY